MVIGPGSGRASSSAAIGPGSVTIGPSSVAIGYSSVAIGYKPGSDRAVLGSNWAKPGNDRAKRWPSGEPGGNRANRLGKTEPASPEDPFSRSRPVTRPDPALRAPSGVTSRRRPAETVAQSKSVPLVQWGRHPACPKWAQALRPAKQYYSSLDLSHGTAISLAE
jgi:hypothetical protein